MGRPPPWYLSKNHTHARHSLVGTLDVKAPEAAQIKIMREAKGQSMPVFLGRHFDVEGQKRSFPIFPRLPILRIILVSVSIQQARTKHLREKLLVQSWAAGVLSQLHLRAFIIYNFLFSVITVFLRQDFITQRCARSHCLAERGGGDFCALNSNFCPGSGRQRSRARNSATWPEVRAISLLSFYSIDTIY
jgi:hypothetical protein